MQVMIADIPVEVVKKRIKNINLSVLPPDGRVRVSAPRSVSNAAIAAFVETKLDWIRRQQRKLEAQPQLRPHAYESGEMLYLWGRPYVLQLDPCVRGHSVRLEGERVILTARRECTAEQRGQYLREWYQAELTREVGRYLPKWEATTGLYSSGWQSKAMKTRWGTCNTATGKIWLNLQLAQRPVECLEYVILHELAHLQVRNHGAEFKALLDRYMPDWRSRRRLLNGGGE